MGRALNMEAVSEVVGSMADSILRSPDALTSLTRLKQFDEYTFFHSVNTSILALSVGRHLGYRRAPLLQLGTGMLLHDIGKTQIPIEILNKLGRYEADEFEIMKQHVLRGAEILSHTTGLTDMFLKPTLEHHERVDGTGYPHQRSRTDLSQFGRIAAIVDIYDAVTSDRCYHKGKTPHDTLQILYQLGTRGHVDGELVQQFVQVVGVYPVGSCVSLNTGERAIVKQVNHHAPLQPLVVLITDEEEHVRSSPATSTSPRSSKNRIGQSRRFLIQPPWGSILATILIRTPHDGTRVCPRTFVDSHGRTTAPAGDRVRPRQSELWIHIAGLEREGLADL